MREIRSIRRERGKGHSRVCSLLFLPLSAPPPPLLYTPRSSLLSPSPPSLAPFVCTSNSLRSRGARDAKRHEVRTRAVSFGFRRPHATRPIESQKTRPLSSPLSSLSLRPSTSIQMARRLKKAQLFLATLVVSGAALLAASSAPHRASATFVAPTTPPTFFVVSFAAAAPLGLLQPPRLRRQRHHAQARAPGRLPGQAVASLAHPDRERGGEEAARGESGARPPDDKGDGGGGDDLPRGAPLRRAPDGRLARRGPLPRRALALRRHEAVRALGGEAGEGLRGRGRREAERAGAPRAADADRAVEPSFWPGG